MKRRFLVARSEGKCSLAQSQGFVGLAMLLVVLSTGASLLALKAVGIRAHSHARATQNIKALGRSARVVEALMAHSTLYADVYGPAGAGPGHLSCPDTDVLPGSASIERSLARAGPNPPCALRPSPSGVVPAHVTVGSLRQGIDPDADNAPALSYRVSAEVVNNPIDRVVNTRRLLEQDIRAMASVGVDERLNETADITLSADVLMPVVERRVAAWVIQRVDETLISPAVAESVSSPGCAESAGCVVSDIAGIMAVAVEGVVRERHWFWRNRWSDEFRLRIDLACVSAPQACSWAIDDRERREASRVRAAILPVIVLALLPLSLE